ncbi:hypothetical protein [Malikia spinosa]|uniref:Uncharacterized protein n=1 Tax=Malikia spinosa TaxID=86180 RepID=A0A7C9IW12_9BURK|nr:hypothetical protein [Malikia spinosa]MYZ50873.1 hypothetical protein [Malikia spinosa]
MNLLLWQPIVRKALEEGIEISAGPIPGARLRQLIARYAADANLSFPPDPDSTFSSFLDHFQDLLFVQRRPGHDMLVVPGDRVALLSATKDTPQSAVLRRDLFEALTIIPKEGAAGPLYIRSSDSVFWPMPGIETPADAVVLPFSTRDLALEDRREFVAQTRSKELRTSLETSLTHSKPLHSFSEAVRAHGLAREWHQFRLGKLLERLKRWSEEKAVPWRTVWFLESEQVATQSLGTAPGPTGASNVQDFFAALAVVLKEGDLARISIPLDLVAKAWSQRS